MKKWIIGLGLGSTLLAPFVIGLVLILLFGAALGGIMNMLQGGAGSVMTAAGYEELCQTEEGGTVPIGETNGWSNPAKGYITSPYGMRVHPITGVYKLHDGTDISGGPGNSDVGQPVYAASSGTVTVESNGAYGAHFVTITHAGGIQTQYGHMSAHSVQNGTQVSAGQKIGEMGDEGLSGGAHLHFIVRVNGETTDPAKFLKEKGVTIGADDPTKPVGGNGGTQNVGDIGPINGTPGQPVTGNITVSHGNIPNRTGDAGFASSIRTLVQNQPDFVTLNEVSRHGTDKVARIAGRYSAYRDPSHDRGSGGQDMGNMVLWRDDWTLVSAGRVKIVEDDQAIFKGRKVKWDRFAQWALLRRADGAVTSIVSVHHMTNPFKFPRQWGNPPMSRAEQYGKGMDTLLSLVSALEEFGPVLVGGDMNTHASYTDKPLSAASKMQAAGFNWMNHGVDFIFFNKQQGIRMQGGRTLNIASDHKGLTATFAMNGAGPGGSGNQNVGNTLPTSWTGKSSNGESVTLDRKQLQFAAMIANKGGEMGVSDDGIIIAFMTAFVESKGINAATAGKAFNNYASDVYPQTVGNEYPKGAVGSDSDSVGLFQQRPAAGWGEPMELMDPAYAASAFFGGPKGPNGGSPMGLLDHTGWESRPKGEVAQDVQVSAHPERYAAWENASRELLQVVKGSGGVVPAVDPNCPASQTGQTQGFTVGTFNILGYGHTEGSERPGWPSGDVRFPQAMDLLSTKGVSIAALQEMHSQNQKMFWKNYSQTWGGCRGVQDYVVWNKAEWREVQCESVNIPYFNGKKRAQPFVLLEQVSTGEKVWFMGIHNPANTNGPAGHWRTEALRIEKAAIQAKIAQGYPVIIGGDFNDGKDGNTNSQCILSPPMTNAFGPSPGGCQPPKAAAPIDHLYSAGLTLVSATVDTSPQASQISDHPLVTAVVPSETTGGGNCSPTGANPIASAGMYAPNAVDISNCMFGSFDQYISSIGGYRPSSISGNHETGCALDIMIADWAGAGKAGGDQIAEWLMANREQYGVQYVIWRQRIWSTPRYNEGWRPLGDRGSPTANHMDHVHVSVFGPKCVVEV